MRCPLRRAAARRQIVVGVLDVAREPFRVMFPAAVLAGVLGVLAWPLHFSGLLETYPGPGHARIMTHGFFGGFVLGFLGTALPRMLKVRPFPPWAIAGWLGLHLVMVGLLFTGWIATADVLLLVLLTLFAVGLVRRVIQRNDLPPPGFVLVALSLASLATGTVLALWQRDGEPDPGAVLLQHLLSYQGFILPPILGVGAFLLPRFLGLPNHQDFPDSHPPPAGWAARAFWALGVGLAIFGSFGLEAAGWPRAAAGLRLTAVVVHLVRELPLWQRRDGATVWAGSLRTAMILLLAGFAGLLVWPGYRVAWLHSTLVGGCALITFVVATRVVYGHSGNHALLAQRQRWWTVIVVLMVIALVTRITGDFVPKILVSHYSYAAALWAIGTIWWAIKVLPKVRLADRDEEPVDIAPPGRNPAGAGAGTPPAAMLTASLRPGSAPQTGKGRAG